MLPGRLRSLAITEIDCDEDTTVVTRRVNVTVAPAHRIERHTATFRLVYRVTADAPEGWHARFTVTLIYINPHPLDPDTVLDTLPAILLQATPYAREFIHTLAHHSGQPPPLTHLPDPDHYLESVPY